MQARFQELRSELAELHDLAKARGLLSWDQQVMMPRRGAAVRAEQLATLEKTMHARFTSDEMGRMLEDLRPYEESLPYESDEASLIRVARRDWEKARKVPTELRAEMARSAALAIPGWVDARARSDFDAFLPHLERNLALRRRYVECFEPDGDPYDVVLDDFEPGMKTAEVRAVFERLKEEQIPLIAAIGGRGDVDDPTQGRIFPLEAQKRFERVVVDAFGFTEDAWRLDPTVHPFASNTCTTDIRITTRYFDDNLDGLFGTMHEFGHGLYEHQIDPALERTPLCRGTSLGLHESQSRMWENLVGRSRPFWRRFFPKLQELFPDALGDVDEEAWYRGVNKVEPSLIRVEADEATYNLHIILRFELEQDLLAGTVQLRDLPEIWSERMRDYLGIDVPDDRRGVLQDTHWALGSIGYFPTYALGNVISLQLWERIEEEIPDLEEQFEAGDFAALRDWLRENLHRHGRKFTPKEMLERVVGGGIDPEPYARYLHSKFGEIYQLSAA